MNFRKAFASIAATTALAGGITMGGATSASAASHGCGSVGHTNSSGVHKVLLGHLRNGPSSSRTQTLSVAPGTTFCAWCGVYSKYGNFWLHGRLAGGQTKGWIHSKNLTPESGSVKICRLRRFDSGPP
ncbi:hypothetical protein I3F60_00140 [Streptomyces sp. MUM 136J]|uniref:hypothetical protein n=1 Tax=Streptomyces sp. MUM 136J TaxID=2791992 RepID=UPI001F0490F6|nr:hypothetical protein [Streptomyces sp. MUM 136J]MCH0567690.1 hypothetical protein [Streptomyces sp. MUM 136J]